MEGKEYEQDKITPKFKPYDGLSVSMRSVGPIPQFSKTESIVTLGRH